MKLKYLMVLAMICALSVGLVACGSDDSDDSSSSSDSTRAKLIESNSANQAVKLKIGSKNFTEQIVLGEIYSQGLQAAGYDVTTDLNLGSETVALQALKAGEISGYPEYVSTALTSFYDTAPGDVPTNADDAFAQVQGDVEKDGLEAFPPTPFQSANAVGLLTSTADELGVKTISDLEGKSQDLKLYGSPECRQRVDCLVGLEDNYGLDFKSFTPVDIGLRYTVLDKKQADLSIVFTTDAQLGVSDEYTILEDDKGLLPAGNVVFLTDKKTVSEAGPDYQSTIEAVQSGLTEEVMQELDARVDIDKETPKAVAADYLQAAGYTE
ncbi:MAG: quaternary ammonium transporter [Solirubrobacterales bacterium]|nr:quaternary ammonium transporter [Solirubrobacterales bacterium]